MEQFPGTEDRRLGRVPVPQTFAYLLAICLASVLTSGARAQTLLRWKLNHGESFSVEMRQETESQVAFSGKSANTKIDLDLQLAWAVTAADNKQFVLKQSIERIQLKLAGAQGTAEYDSAAKTRPTGQA